MAKDISGGCKCGAVRYRGERADVSTFRCYCRDCQQLTGAGHSEMFPLLASTFRITSREMPLSSAGDNLAYRWSILYSIRR